MFRRLRGLAARDRQSELMDDPDLDESLHIDALRGLRRVNLLSGTTRVLWRAIGRAVPAGEDRPLRILDLACGSGDVAIGLAQRAARAGRPAEVVGCDVSEVAVRIANEAATAAGVNARFEIRDVLQVPLPRGFDVVCCSLFLHHLEDEETVRLLRRMRESGAGCIVVSDLIRSRWGYVLGRVGTQLLTRSPIVHVDGPLSVRAALTVKEAAACADRAGLTSVRITTHWPQRFLLTWIRSREEGE